MRKAVSVAVSLMLSSLLAGGVATAAAPKPVPAYIAAALADPSRGQDREADARRHGAELAAFAGVKPGDKVLDLIPGGGYFTRIFAKIVGLKGRVYGVWPEPYAKVAHPDPENLTALSQQPGYGNVRVLVQPADALAAPEPLDVVFTSQNYHDYPDKFMGSLDPAVLNNAVFKALKPGGTYIVIDHVAEAGSGLRDTDTLHRIDPEIVKRQVQAAGFVYEGEIDALRNPADPHTIKVFDPSIRGRTDQFVFKFKKPGGKRRAKG